MTTIYILSLIIFILFIWNNYEKYSNINDIVNTNKCIINKINGYIAVPDEPGSLTGPIRQINFFNDNKLIYSEGRKVGKKFSLTCPKNECITEFKYSNYNGPFNLNIANLGKVKCNNKLSDNTNLGPTEYFHTWSHKNFFYKPDICKCLNDKKIEITDKKSYIAKNMFYKLKKMVENNKLESVNFIGDNEETPKKNRILMQNFKTSIDYILGFIIKPLSTINTIGNILHFLSNNSNYGSKIPAVFIQPNSLKIHIQQDTLKKLAVNAKSKILLKKNVHYFVEIKVLKNKLGLYINGKLQHKINIGYGRYEMTNVNVYMGSPNFVPANITISNIIYVRLTPINGYYVSYYNRLLKDLIGSELILNKNINLVSGLVLNSGRQNNIGLTINGYIKAPLTGSYKFRLAINDGARLYINNKRMINQWKDQSGIKSYNSFSSSYHIRDLLFSFKIDWYNNNGPYSLVMYWLQPGYKVWKIIPKENFLFFK